MIPLKTILVVDDEQGFRELYQFALTPLGCEVVAVMDGVEAVAMVTRRAFDLVLMDVHMPRMQGPEALVRIKAVRPGQKVVMISSSADHSDAFEREAVRRGALECLYKPVELAEMLRVVERHVGPLRGGTSRE